ncbi:hypothetical protein M2369_000172 [Bacillus sp. JUb11]|nr:hypothetical protein [Bacillus sp. JUb11]
MDRIYKLLLTYFAIIVLYLRIPYSKYGIIHLQRFLIGD